LGLILKNLLIHFVVKTVRLEKEMAAINKIKTLSSLLTEPIIARNQASLFSRFGYLFSGKSFVRARNTEFKDTGSSSLHQCLNFYIETSIRTWG
jgi:hypothetical protein